MKSHCLLLFGTLVQLASLSNTKHILEITGDASAPITSIRVRRPPLK
ncbi:hypothetical protein [Prosthecobacter sp.]